MIGAQQDPGHNLRDVDNLSSMSMQLASLPSSPGVMITHNRFHSEPGPGQKPNIAATSGHLQVAVNSLLPLYQPLLQMCSPSLVFTAAVSWHHWHLMRHLLSQFILRSGMAHVLPGQTPAHNWAPRNVTGPQPLSGPGTQQPRGGDTEAIRPDKTDQDIRVDNKNIKRIVLYFLSTFWWLKYFS